MIRLNIEQQYAKIELSITDPTISLRTQAPRLEIDTEAAVVEIRQPKGTLEIDQSPCRASYGYKHLDRFTRDLAQEAKQIALEAIGTKAQEGDRMARIESGEDVIIALAVEATTAEQLEVGIVPIEPPYIRYHPSPPEYQVTPGKVNTNLQRGTVDLQLNRGTVQAAMAQYQSVRMWTTGSFNFSA